MKLRTGLLLGAAFAAGVAAVPVSTQLEQRFSLSLFPIAFAQDSTRAETYRLLTLFGDVFERIRAEYVEPAVDRDMIENAINGMLTGLDPHSSYMNAKQFRDMQVHTRGEFGGLGMEVTQEGGYIRVISPIDDTPAMRAGVKAGDLILSLDGKTVQGLSLNEAVDKIKGAPGSRITITIKRAGVDTPIEMTMQREVIKIQVVKSRLEGGDIAYIRITSFNEQTDAGLRKAVATLRAQAGDKLKGIVLDLRNNPGGLLDQAVAVSDDFISQGEIVSTRARHTEDSQRWNAKDGDITSGLPIVVLINGGSASASEIVAGALQDHRRAIIMGSRSFGKGSVQTVIPLPGNGAMRLTTARYYTPSGRSIQSVGVEPDIIVPQAKIEVIDRPRGQREADLRGALNNNGETDPAAQPNGKTPEAIPAVPGEGNKTDPAKPQAAAKPADAAADYQLERAYDLIRGVSMFARKSGD